ncbi:hypothetical protein HZH66_002086 [Vespula vulgaris]|uniref:Uncharacterized protein n=1 Tax=Vespula vulgaris TaxID=7454 RepID=A0A834KMG4_VESVU|nr:hypothetical protein HZH66_002086 [Vespula vulgaris]
MPPGRVALKRGARADWRPPRGTALPLRAVPHADWLPGCRSTGRRGVPGGASQSRLACSLAGLAGWLAGWLALWLTTWLVGWLAC